MQQQTAHAAPVNRVSATALAQLRTTKLDLETRLIAQLQKRNGFADEALVRSFVHSLQSDLEARLEELQRWDSKNGLAVRGSRASDLTLANATSWAVWNEQRTLLPQSTDMFEGKRPVAQETLADVADDDPRWADLLEKIHADVFFISINWGSAKRGLPVTPRSYRFDTDFLNFHENVPHRNTRDALLNRFERFIAPFADEHGTEPFCASHLSGGYLTDLYKGIPTPTQAELAKVLGKENKHALLDVMLELLELELEILRGPARPVLVCMGRAVEKPVSAHFTPLGYKVIYLPHYSPANGRFTIDQRRELFRELDRAVGEAKLAVPTNIASPQA